jgi:hypothetical protein
METVKDKNQNSKQVPTVEGQNEGLYKHSTTRPQHVKKEELNKCIIIRL